jgi:integrase/recombinase XerD
LRVKYPYSYNSVFAPEMKAFLELRAAQGHVARHAAHMLETLDISLIEHNSGELSPNTIDLWMNSLHDKMNANTLITYVSYYTQFAKYMAVIGVSAFIPERPKGNHDYVPYVFTSDEMQRLFAACDNLPGTRNFAKAPVIFPVLIRLLYGCGLRLDEALSLQLKDLDLTEGIIHVNDAKGFKDRVVPMDESLNDICRKYCKLLHHESENTAYLFENHHQTRFSQVWARHWFEITLKNAGIALPESYEPSRGICLHCLRHTFAVDSFRKMEMQGRDLYEFVPFLSTYMGHYDLYSTEKYLRMTAEIHNRVIDQMAEYASDIFPGVTE